MQINTVSPQSIWSFSTTPFRSLTNAGFMNTAQSANQSLPASSTNVFVTPSGVVALLSLGIKAGAAGTATYGVYDATNQFTFTSVAAGQFGGVALTSIGQSIGGRLQNNDAANAATYAFILTNIVL